MQQERTSRELRAARVSRRPPRFAATAMALGIVFALAYVFLLRTPPPIPTPDVASIQGTYVLVRDRATPAPGATPHPASTLSGSFVALASGDAGGTLRPGPATQAGDFAQLRSSYEASSRAELSTWIRASGTQARRTLDAWPPVWRVGTLSPLDYQGLAAVVRSAVEDKDRTVGIKPLKDGDRTVWRAAMRLDGSTVELVVDQKTGLVVWYSQTSGSRTDTFSATPAWGVSPSRDQLGGAGASLGSAGSRDVIATRRDTTYAYAPSLNAAGRAAGYAPLASDLAPDGFTLRAVATADTKGAPGAWLVNGQSTPVDLPAGQRQVAQLYTRGLSWFAVQQLGPQAAGSSAAFLRDTLPSIAAGKLSYEATTLQYGALTGATAYTWYENSGPTLLTGDARHIVYVTGALTRQELIAFAEGLKPRGAGVPASPSPSP